MELEIINKLERILESKDYREIHLKNFESDFKTSLFNYSKLCENCKELQILDLPNDCLSNPTYCVKNKNDLKLISLYEEIELNIKLM
ncbi:hypothetical protein [Chryseobacterium echinoideorum]|uniref:hypothetical protein n=1 Tax=Chryseobacterium echinoideorum TaxID=1549648 RepID=UPI0011862B57|nr:hypothetical protein [Chryseobacterium echinoideorum]